MRSPTVTFDEEYGFRAAKAAGLTMLDSWIEHFGEVPIFARCTFRRVMSL
ncbi:hypothetical protein [Cryobacterium sp. Y82]|nr:hypothetical protein [Cryobacterium sp. Y82]